MKRAARVVALRIIDVARESLLDEPSLVEAPDR